MATTRDYGGAGTRTKSRIGVIAAVATLAAAFGGTNASAEVNNASSIVDAEGNRIEVLQMDTVIRTVPPLDSSPLSVEFFHDGVATVVIEGPDAESFTGTELTIGYQIGYPIGLAGATVVLNSPALVWEVNNESVVDIGVLPQEAQFLNFGVLNGGAIGGDIIPSQELDIDLVPGGITDVPLLEGQEFDGPAASVRLAGIQGYVQGALGPVTIRPYAKAVTENGDTVVTYGTPQRLKDF